MYLCELNCCAIVPQLDFTVVCRYEPDWLRLPIEQIVGSTEETALACLHGLQLPMKYQPFCLHVTEYDSTAQGVLYELSKHAKQYKSLLSLSEVQEGLEIVAEIVDEKRYHNWRATRGNALTDMAYRVQMRVLQYLWSSNDSRFYKGLERREPTDLLAMLCSPRPSQDIVRAGVPPPTDITINATRLRSVGAKVVNADARMSIFTNRMLQYLSAFNGKRFSTGTVLDWDVDDTPSSVDPTFAQFLLDVCTLQQRLILLHEATVEGFKGGAVGVVREYRSALSAFNASL